MTTAWQIALLLLGSYLVGSIPFGLIASRIKGVDIRRYGSGNVGATNVGRALGRWWGALVLLLDVTKGASTTLAARIFMTHAGGGLSHADSTTRDLLWLGTGVCCIIGNVAPAYLRFRGGKGVATSLGVILGIYPYLTWPGLVALAVWAIVVKWSGYISLGSMSAACVMPLAFVAICRIVDWKVHEHYPLLALCVAMALLVLLRHRANMGRLLAGTENKVGRGVT